MTNEEIIATKQRVLSLKIGFLIIGGPNDLAYGTLQKPQALFVWTTREKAQAFLDKNLNPKDDKVIERTQQQISTFANEYYSSIRFDFQTEDPGPFLHLAVGDYLVPSN